MKILNNGEYLLYLIYTSPRSGFLQRISSTSKILTLSKEYLARNFIVDWQLLCIFNNSFFMLPHQNIIYIEPQNDRFFNKEVWNFIFWITKKQNSVWWCKFSPNGSPLRLLKISLIMSKIYLTSIIDTV